MHEFDKIQNFQTSPSLQCQLKVTAVFTFSRNVMSATQ